MNAPVDIIISIIDRMTKEAINERNDEETFCPAWHEYNGKALGLQEFKEQLEGFKRLFN